MDGGLSSADFRCVAILGCGLIGGSIDLAIRQRAPGTRVLTFDRDDDPATAVEADLIVLAAPIHENIRLLSALKPQLSPSTILTDTGSTKAAVVAAAAGMRFVGGHPIAGGTVSGRAAARADLFSGRRWVLTPVRDTPAEDLARVAAFVESLGASVDLLGPDEHDRLFALTSHLPQLVVSALMDVVGAGAGAHGLALAGQGLRDTTRLADSPPEIWRDILDTNRAHIATAIDALIGILATLRNDATGQQLEAVFERAARWRQNLDATEGTETPEVHNGGTE